MESFDAVYKQHYQDLYRYVYRYFHRREPCEDIVQETFLRLYKQHQKKGCIEYEKAWLYKVATNLSLSKLQRSKKWTLIQPGLTYDTPSVPSPDEIFEKAESSRRVFKVLAKLKKRDRVLLMLYQEKMTYKEMSEITGIKSTSVGKLLSRAFEQCARLLEEAS
ncbi:RNA polymerase sigma factor [bacterium]|nr:RNA polymerase sigma factor [bacterium]